MEVQATGGRLAVSGTRRRLAVCGTLRRPAALALAALIATLLTLTATPRARADAVAHATRVGSAPASEQLDLVLPLVADKAGLRRFALAVTTIGSPEYGQFESIPQLAARFGASARTRARVVRFLRAAGATGVRVDGTGLFVDATLSAGRAQRLLVHRRHDRPRPGRRRAGRCWPGEAI